MARQLRLLQGWIASPYDEDTNMKNTEISQPKARQTMDMASNAEYLILCSTHSGWNIRQKELLSDLLGSFDLILQKNGLGYLASIDLSDYGTCLIKAMMVSGDDQAVAVLGQLLDEFGINETEGFYRDSSNADCARRINRCLKEFSSQKEAA